MKTNAIRFFVAASVLTVFVFCHSGCESKASLDQLGNANQHESNLSTMQGRKSKYIANLSEYGLYQSPMHELVPSAGVVEYQLNTPLFSDYSLKQRLVKLPEGTSAAYKPKGPLDFPVGTIIAKTFYYRADFNDLNSDRKIIETRILEHQQSGWVGIPYVWTEDQQDAELAIVGGEFDVSWKHTDGELRAITYSVPNLNDCKRCHEIGTMQPIGPRANNLNREIEHDGQPVNQLQHWAAIGLVRGMPKIEQVSRLADWKDQKYSVNERARAYLDVNCAHCHNPAGPARNSGLHLNVDETKPYHLGTFKSPVAAGKGTGGRIYGIVPGKPDESILEYRLRTTEPGEIMPEFGKSMVHEEGLELIREWILQMEK